MESRLDKLKKFGRLLDDYISCAENIGAMCPRDTYSALTAAKDQFYRLFPEAKIEKEGLNSE